MKFFLKFSALLKDLKNNTKFSVLLTVLVHGKHFFYLFIFIFFLTIVIGNISVFMDNLVFATVFSGVLVFVVQKIVSELVIIPFLNYRKVVGEIDNRLKLYSNVIYNKGLPNDLINKAMDALRELSCDLESSHKMMVLKIGNSTSEVAEASSLLIFLSNSTGMNNSDFFYENLEKVIKAEEVIRIILKIKKY